MARENGKYNFVTLSCAIFAGSIVVPQCQGICRCIVIALPMAVGDGVYFVLSDSENRFKFYLVTFVVRKILPNGKNRIADISAT